MISPGMQRSNSVAFAIQDFVVLPVTSESVRRGRIRGAGTEMRLGETVPAEACATTPQARVNVL